MLQIRSKVWLLLNFHLIEIYSVVFLHLYNRGVIGGVASEWVNTDYFIARLANYVCSILGTTENFKFSQFCLCHIRTHTFEHKSLVFCLTSHEAGRILHIYNYSIRFTQSSHRILRLFCRKNGNIKHVSKVHNQIACGILFWHSPAKAAPHRWRRERSVRISILRMAVKKDFEVHIHDIHALFQLSLSFTY